MFHGLTRGNIEAIADIQLKKIGGMLASRRIKLELTPDARKYVIDMGYEPRFGARPLRRALQRYLQDPLSSAILEGGYQEGETVLVKLKTPDNPENGLAFEKKSVEDKAAA
jgi:ATP-dependent Clp protease ATP-binding subunit ClpB